MLSTLRSRLISTTKSSQLHRNVGFMYLSTKKAIETKEWFMWPRETEANDYAVNWSLVGDGVTPTGNAYRNARLPLLTSMLSAKPAGNMIFYSFIHPFILSFIHSFMYLYTFMNFLHSSHFAQTPSLSSSLLLLSDGRWKGGIEEPYLFW